MLVACNRKQSPLLNSPKPSFPRPFIPVQAYVFFATVAARDQRQQRRPAAYEGGDPHWSGDLCLHGQGPDATDFYEPFFRLVEKLKQA